MVDQSPTSPSVQAPRRPQFTLRALLLATTAAALLFALMAYRGWLGAFVFVLVCIIGFSIASFRQGRKKWSLGFLYAAFVWVGVIGPCAPYTHVRQSEYQVCTKCGLLRQTTEERLIGNKQIKVVSEAIRPTEISMWYQKHFGVCANHTWILQRSTRRDFASIFGLQWGGHHQDTSVQGCDGHLNAQDRQRLDELFVQDKAACKKAISKLFR